jgi:acetyltransferase
MPYANENPRAGGVVGDADLRAPFRVRRVLSTELRQLAPELGSLLAGIVDSGFPLGFLAPLSRDEAERYWTSLAEELRVGSRVLLVASLRDRIVASGQLAFPPWTNARHRAEVQKVFTSGTFRGRGLGLRMMRALHETALQCGRSLVTLNTRHGGYAESFYRQLGYQVIGTTPGYYRDASGRRTDNIALYIELADPAVSSD